MNILYLCTGNSARSIMAEAYTNHLSRSGKAPEDWQAYSAGSTPTGAPNPYALKTLSDRGISAGKPRSKSWNEFTGDEAPFIDRVITVCDNAAGEVCPIWPSRDGRRPEMRHWSFPDPAAVHGDETEKMLAFSQVFDDICAKIDAMAATEKRRN